MKISNPHTIRPSEVKINKRVDLLSGNVSSGECVNVGYYDDTEIKRRISLLETEVSDITQLDVNFNWRLQQLEAIDHDQYATKTELQAVGDRVTILETIPVGLPDEQINEIFEM